MNTGRYFRIAAIAAVSMLITTAQPVLAEKERNHERQILAGPIGKSSSASARITLVIPPRPDKKAEQTQPEDKTKRQTDDK